MIKTILKLLVCIIVYTVVFMAANALMPFSQGFKDLSASEDPAGLLLQLINMAWVCFTIYFIVRNANFSGLKLFFFLLGTMFFVQQFMTQIETLLFGFAFPVLKKSDVIMIMLAGLFPLAAVIPLMIKFFKNSSTIPEKPEFSIKKLIPKLAVIGLLYCIIYSLFGFFIAWRFEELRNFYTGLEETLSFGNRIIGFEPILLIIQMIRGILFGIFIIPLRMIIVKSKKTFIIGVCLVYLCTAAMLVAPNVLMPGMVRIGHLLEMTSSMLLFGIIAGNLLWGKS